MARKQLKLESFQLTDALSIAFSDLESLQDEMQSWYDNMPEGLQGGDKGCAVEEAASALSYIQETELPASIVFEDDQEPRVEVVPLKRGPSRSARRDHAVALLQSVKDWAEERLETLTQTAELDKGLGLTDEAPVDEVLSELESFIDDLGNAIDEAEGVEFPGMYG